MYELAGYQLLHVETVETDVQVATVKSCVEVVVGYDSDEPTTFGYIPSRPGGDYQLHYENGALVWKPIMQNSQ